MKVARKFADKLVSFLYGVAIIASLVMLGIGLKVGFDWFINTKVGPPIILIVLSIAFIYVAYKFGESIRPW